MTPPEDKESLGQDSYPIPQDADFAVLGMASAALLHRLHNTLGILGPQLVRLRMHVNTIDKDDRSSLDAILGIVDAMERQIHSVDELIATVDVLKKPTAQPAPLDVNSLLYEVWEEFHTNRMSKTVQVSLELPENVPPRALSFSSSYAK